MNIEINETSDEMLHIWHSVSGLEINVYKKYINNFKKFLKQVLINRYHLFQPLIDIYKRDIDNIDLGDNFYGNYIVDMEIEELLNLLDKKYKSKRIRIDTLNKSKLDKLDFEDLVYVYNKIKERK